MGVGSALLGGAGSGPLPLMSRGSHLAQEEWGVMKKRNPLGLNPSLFPPWERGPPPGSSQRGQTNIKALPLGGEHNLGPFFDKSTPPFFL